MMYGNKLAAAIKVNGKVLREFKDTVYVPFGSEYTILIKNLGTQRAIVNVYIDGDNVVSNGLVLNAGQEVDLERSVRNNNLSEGNRFKFIERSGSVEQHRGIKLEDGLIRIEHQFELPQVYTTPWIAASGSIYPSSGVVRGMSLNDIQCSTSSVSYDSYSVNSSHATLNDTGITVPGSHSTQQFRTTSIGALESTTHNMIIKLLGDLGDNKPVTKPVTVKHKPKCVTCGKQNRHNAKFCVECGTALEIFA